MEIKETKDIDIRLNKIEGQVKGIKKMIDDKRICDDVLIQLAAVNKSIKSLANLIIDKHLRESLVPNIEQGNYKAIDEIIDLFKKIQ